MTFMDSLYIDLMHRVTFVQYTIIFILIFMLTIFIMLLEEMYGRHSSNKKRKKNEVPD